MGRIHAKPGYRVFQRRPPAPDPPHGVAPTPDWTFRHRRIPTSARGPGNRTSPSARPPMNLIRGRTSPARDAGSLKANPAGAAQGLSRGRGDCAECAAQGQGDAAGRRRREPGGGDGVLQARVHALLRFQRRKTRILLGADTVQVVGLVLDGCEIRGRERRPVEIGINAVVQFHAWEGFAGQRLEHSAACADRLDGTTTGTCRDARTGPETRRCCPSQVA